MKLYGSLTSPYVRHCRIALLEEEVEVEFCKADSVLSAVMSPMQKVPYMECEVEGNKFVLSDSLAILKFIREQKGRGFLANVKSVNDFCATTTIMDACINVFYLEKDGLTPRQSAYLERQNQRIQTGLQYLEKQGFSENIARDDVLLRLACFLDWALFRNRVSLSDFPSLRGLLERANNYPIFEQTKPKE